MGNNCKNLCVKPDKNFDILDEINISNELDKEIFDLKFENCLIKKKFQTVERDFLLDYKILKEISIFKNGKKYLVKCKKTGTIREMISIYKSELTKKEEENIINYFHWTSEIDHPSISNIYNLYIDLKFLYIIYETNKHQTIINYLDNNNIFNENQIIQIIENISYILNFLHSKNILIKNLNVCNFSIEIVNNRINTYLINILEFIINDVEINLNVDCNNFYFYSPEQFENKIYKESSIYSLGILLYFLVSGKLPFQSFYYNSIKKLIKKNLYNIDIPEMNSIDSNINFLIRRMLQLNPEDRINIKDILNNSWVKTKMRRLNKNFTFQLEDFKNFSKYNKLRRAFLNFISFSKLLESEEYNFFEIFRKYDLENKGFLTKNQFKNLLLRKRNSLINNNIIDEEIEEIINRIDVNNTGNIEYTEFLSIYINKKKLLNENHLKKIFKIFDNKGDGYIDNHEWNLIFESTEDEYILDIIKEIKSEEIGKINLEEFINIFN